MGKTTLLFEAYVLKTKLHDEASEKAFGDSLGKDITDGASKDFGTSTNPYGVINGAVINAAFGVTVVGITKDDKLVCEYQTEESVQCVLYAPRSGELKALVYNNVTKKTSTYALSKAKLNGEALFAALIAYSYYHQENSEFVKLYDQLMKLRADNYTNFIGQMLPIVDDRASCKKYSFEEIITSGDFDSFLIENNLPTYMDIYCDAEAAYRKLTGGKKENATENECVVILAHKLMGLIESENAKNKSDNGQRFQYVETDFIRAIRNGWVVEIQECGVILQPGVLVGLNGLLDQTASIRLANGEMVKRHPDSVVILTTNSTYEGCRPLNQSVLSRMSLILDMPELTAEQMRERATKRTGFADEDTLKLMVEVLQSIRKHCREKSIDDGVCGMRELMAWIQSYQITEELIESAKLTVISTATADAECQEELFSACVKPYISD